MEIPNSVAPVSHSGSDRSVREIVPNDPSDPRFWAFWAEIRELTCPTDHHLDDEE